MFSARVLSSESYDKMHHVCEPCEIQQHTLMLLAVVRNSLQTVTFFAAGMKINAQQQSNTVGDNMKSSCLDHPAFMTLLINATAWPLQLCAIILSSTSSIPQGRMHKIKFLLYTEL